MTFRAFFLDERALLLSLAWTDASSLDKYWSFFSKSSLFDPKIRRHNRPKSPLLCLFLGAGDGDGDGDGDAAGPSSLFEESAAAAVDWQASSAIGSFWTARSNRIWILIDWSSELRERWELFDLWDSLLWFWGDLLHRPLYLIFRSPTLRGASGPGLTTSRPGLTPVRPAWKQRLNHMKISVKTISNSCENSIKIT